MSWISKQDKQQEIKRKPSVTLKEKDTLQVNVDFVKLYSYATKDLFYMFEKKTVEKETVAVSAVPTAVTAPTTVAAPVVENAKVITDDKASTLTNGSKSSDKDR
jgi:hypothetical protein